MFFLFWNDFDTELQPEDKKNSPSKRSSTPRSGKRKRRAISPITVDQNSPAFKKAKKNLDFSNRTEKEEAPTQGKNILNLPYTDSEDEEEQGVDLTKQVAVENEELPSPTPREDLVKQVIGDSYRKPRSQRIN